jgi:hypothetical protein
MPDNHLTSPLGRRPCGSCFSRGVGGLGSSWLSVRAPRDERRTTSGGSHPGHDETIKIHARARAVGRKQAAEYAAARDQPPAKKRQTCDGLGVRPLALILLAWIILSFPVGVAVGYLAPLARPPAGLAAGSMTYPAVLPKLLWLKLRWARRPPLAR